MMQNLLSCNLEFKQKAKAVAQFQEFAGLKIFQHTVLGAYSLIIFVSLS